MQILFFSAINCLFAVSYATSNYTEPPWFENLVLESTVVLYNISTSFSSAPMENSTFYILSYGVRISYDQIILPANSDEFYEYIGDISFLNENIYYRGIPFALRQSLLSKFTKGILTQLNDGAFILDSSAERFYHRIWEKKYLKISRYPICNNEENLKTILFNETETIVTEYYSSGDCETFFPDFDGQKQSCSEFYNQTKSGIPLILSYDGQAYLVGLSDPRSIENSTLYNLIADECYGFPVYAHCAGLTSPSKYTFCNSAQISLDLKENDGIILFGNVQDEKVTSFIPFGLGTVVSDNQIILPKTVLDSLDNFEIYGNGKELKLALMIDRKVKVFESNDYETISTGKRMLKLVKFIRNIFDNIQKPKLLFDEKQGNLEELEIFQFNDERQRYGGDESSNDEKLQLQKFQKRQKYGETEIKENERFLVGAPVFYNGTIIGFQNQDSSYLSAFEVKGFLQNNVPTLNFEVSSETVV